MVGYRSSAASLDPTCSFSLGLASEESRDSIKEKNTGQIRIISISVNGQIETKLYPFLIFPQLSLLKIDD
jgi:hypothetical protein